MGQCALLLPKLFDSIVLAYGRHVKEAWEAHNPRSARSFSDAHSREIGGELTRRSTVLSGTSPLMNVPHSTLSWGVEHVFGW